MVPRFYGFLGMVGGYHGFSGERMVGKKTLLFEGEVSVGEVFHGKSDNFREEGSWEDFI